MQAVLVLVGRPNVGKSTLFNRLTRTRDALVTNIPGLTRDRKYGIGQRGNTQFVVIDTGGLGEESQLIDYRMGEQSRQALREATHILFLVDGKAGITAGDEILAQEFRELSKPIALVINKADKADRNSILAEVSSLGLGIPNFISAQQDSGIDTLIKSLLGANPSPCSSYESWSDQVTMGIRIAFIGRPNVGKSTLVNRILGENRVLVMDQPGTTRDAIHIPFKRDAQAYTLIDTAGVRRRARVKETIEKFSVIKTLESISIADVVILVLDAKTGISEQDAHLIGLVIDSGAPLVIAINKWDGLSIMEREAVRRSLDLKLDFLNYAERYFISALHGSGVGNLFAAVQRANSSLHFQATSSQLTRLLEKFIIKHQPPLARGRRIKLRFAHPGINRPFTVVIHGNQTERLPGSYKRYLANAYRKALNLVGIPIVIDFRTTENPYAGKYNTLTPRQQRCRTRTSKQVKSKK